METPFSVTTVRVDDSVLLLALFQRVDLPGVLDLHLRRHGNQKGLSWGWIATLWLTHILTQSDHRKVSVRTWIARNRSALAAAVDLEVVELDFTDDKLTLLLARLSDVATWHKIEESLWDAVLLAYHLIPKVVRVDATTLSGYHLGGENSLFQFGKSKEHPELRCLKVMQTTLDPLGLPLTTLVAPGHRADDPLYLPAIDRALRCLQSVEALFVGDVKMSALQTRSFLQARRQRYLTPLACVGETAKQWTEWVRQAREQPDLLQDIVLDTDPAPRNKEAEPGDTALEPGTPEDAERCRGYAFLRECVDPQTSPPLVWQEQVFVVYSPAYAASLAKALDQRLRSAQEKLLALTASPKRRKPTTEADLQKAADRVLQQYRVTGLLAYRLERIVTTSTQYIGRGRGGPERPQRTVETVRYDLVEVTPDPEALQKARELLGWRALVSNAPPAELTLTEAVRVYRDQHSIEQGFHRLKGVPLSLHPLLVHREDQVRGLIHLMSLALRFLTLVEYQVRIALQERNASLVGLHPENPKKESHTPTTERLLQQFQEITLTTVRMGEVECTHITPHSCLQVQILALLDLPPDTYSRLAMNSG